MIINFYAEGRHHPVEVPEFVLQDGESFFAKMDADMDNGWQLGQHWLDKPDGMERCRIVAERMAEALDAGNQQMLALLGGYILRRMPEVRSVRLAEDGDAAETQFSVYP